MEKQPPGKDSYLDLVTANMLRLRRQFGLAQARCGDVLKREPRNAAAHSVMGDIARDRGDPKDAIEWYKRALDLDPGNLPDRRKLEGVIDQAYPREKVGTVERLRDSVAGQIETTAAEMRAARLPWSAYCALGAMLAVIIGVTVVVVALGQRAGSPAMAIAEEQPSGAFVPPPLQPQQHGQATTASAPPAPRFAEEIAALETSLLDHLKEAGRVVDPNCQVTGAELDPRDGSASVRLSMPRVWSAEQTRESILRVAAALARAAAAWDTRVSAVHVRCDVRQEGQPAERAFLGEVDAAALGAAPRDPAAPDNESVFTSIWWAPQLSPGAEPQPAGAPQ